MRSAGFVIPHLHKRLKRGILKTSLKDTPKPEAKGLSGFTLEELQW